jgi:hypothetical protein
MARMTMPIFLGFWMTLVAPASGADVPIATASGIVKKATATALVISPRAPDGRFQNTLVLKLTGTSKISVLTTQKRSGQTVLVQREIDSPSLQTNQSITVIYANVKDDLVLLTAVAQPPASK